MDESIELRLIINPDDSIYDFLKKIKEFLLTDSKSEILRFILNRASKIPLKDFINLVELGEEKEKQLPNQEGKIKT